MRLPSIPLPARQKPPGSKPPGPQPPEPFTIETVIRLEDRVAAAEHVHQDLYRAARQRLLAFLLIILALLLTMAAYNAWQAAAGKGFTAFLTGLGSDLFGLSGLPIALISVPTLIYYLLLPAIIRRRLRRWYRDEGHDQPLAITLDFTPGGLTSSAGPHTSVIACRRISGVEGTSAHAFIGLSDLEDAIVLPKRDLDPDAAARLKQWAACCHVDGPGAEAPQPPEYNTPEGEPAMSFGYMPTAADRAVSLVWQMERPSMQRRRRHGFALAFVLAALAPATLMVLLWLFDPLRVPAVHAAPLLADMFLTDFWQWILGFWIAIGALALAHGWLRRRQAQTLGKELHARLSRPDDHAIAFSLYPDACVWRQKGIYNRVDWRGFAGVRRQGDNLLLLYRGGDPVVIPDRILAAGQREALESKARQWISAAEQRK